jgi:hypothetical protein
LLSSRETDDPAVGEAASLLQLDEKSLPSIRDDAWPKVNTSATYLGIDLGGFNPTSMPSAVAQVQLAPDPTQNQLADEVRRHAYSSTLKKQLSCASMRRTMPLWVFPSRKVEIA